MIETWGFYLFPVGPILDAAELSGEVAQSAYDSFVDIWTRCEDWGFDGLAFAEHHFSPTNLSPSPHLLIATIAAKTERIRFTTLGSVLALHDGRRYAEECGMLHHLTRGRFEPGIAPGAGDMEAVAAGIPADEIRPRYYSAAELLAKAIASPRVTHQNAFSNLKDVAIIPRPRLSQGQSVWATVMSPDSAAWCAERGYKICTAWYPTELAALVGRQYREAAAKAGKPGEPSMLGLRRRVFVADTDSEAQEKYEAAIDYVKLFASRGFETVNAQILQLMMNPEDYSIGSPQTVAERLIEQCRAGGYGVMMAFTDFANFDRADLARSHELIGTKVAPILRSA